MYVQLEEQIRLKIRGGDWRVGEVLPTVRSLAVSLGINANTVSRVYRELQRQGVLRLERGVGTFVAESAGSPMTGDAWGQLESRSLELIAFARERGMRPAELAQFIESRWKEEEHDAR